ncbi:unnamed protein product [Didymodactylos carnosus]|uniref:Uncharacterized protein n=1 Tax=Didymodactylos carnosus TaxID=1234261 RepID=A0A8S2D8A4_9BILA|nr:unnamed protein product [Didymodactylos carnosus]CAF3621739.1 unnamed protein product [Didymodactylos carnosus]
MVTPVDMLGNSVVVGFDDICSAQDGPFYEKFLLKQRLLHPQHVFDYIANQKLKEELMRFNHNHSGGMIMMESICEHVEIEWPEGEETWLIHDELAQRTQFVKYKQQPMLTTSIVENSMHPMSSDCDWVQSSFDHQPNEIMLLLQQLLAKQDLLLDENKQLKQEVATQQITINNLSQAVEAIQGTKISCQNISVTKSSSAPTTASVSELAPPVIKSAELSLKKKASKQLQSKQSDQLIKKPLFSEFFPQYVSNEIDDFSYERGYRNATIFSLKSTAISPSNLFHSLIVQLISIGIVLITIIILVKVGFKFLDSNMIFSGGTNTPYFVNNVLSHGINDSDWFRTLGVP